VEANSIFKCMQNNFFRLTGEPLSEAEARSIIQDPTCGALVLFLGTVRNSSQGSTVNHLEFEAYEPMVYAVLDEIANELRSEFGVMKVLLFHRLGKVCVGETAVIAAVSSAHRMAAFQATEKLMNRLKQSVPIWKKEFTSNGAVWVTPNP
jgi:molybdopterin synthase catalytic subunit